MSVSLVSFCELCGELWLAAISKVSSFQILVNNLSLEIVYILNAGTIILTKHYKLYYILKGNDFVLAGLDGKIDDLLESFCYRIFKFLITCLTKLFKKKRFQISNPITMKLDLIISLISKTNATLKIVRLDSFVSFCWQKVLKK